MTMPEMTGIVWSRIILPVDRFLGQATLLHHLHADAGLFRRVVEDVHPHEPRKNILVSKSLTPCYSNIGRQY
jgi:hypothetical protein